MRLAMTEAAKASSEGNSPFGAVLADLEGNVIATAHSTTKTDMDLTAHAEINIIRQMHKKTGSRDFSNYILISNAQSCPMCFSASNHAQISNFIFGYGEDETLVPKINVFELSKHCEKKLNIETGILKEECKKQIEEARKNTK